MSKKSPAKNTSAKSASLGRSAITGRDVLKPYPKKGGRADPERILEVVKGVAASKAP